MNYYIFTYFKILSILFVIGKVYSIILYTYINKIKDINENGRVEIKGLMTRRNFIKMIPTKNIFKLGL